jgi:hypothetical protein
MNVRMKYQIGNILASIPNDDETKIRYVEKIKKYRNECGCSWGANFLMASLGGIIMYLIFYFDWQNVNPFKLILTVALPIFISSGIGKMIGIGLAKIKLQLLYKSLINQYNPKNE